MKNICTYIEVYGTDWLQLLGLQSASLPCSLVLDKAGLEEWVILTTHADLLSFILNTSQLQETLFSFYLAWR